MRGNQATMGMFCFLACWSPMTVHQGRILHHPEKALSGMQENQELWDLMQQDEVAELDTSAALEGLDLASSMPSPDNSHAMSPDTEQPYKQAGWPNAAPQGGSCNAWLSESDHFELEQSAIEWCHMSAPCHFAVVMSG